VRTAREDAAGGSRALAPLALAVLFAAPLVRQGRLAAASPPAPKTRANVVSIGDIRGGDSSSRLELELELPEFSAAEVAAARLRVRTAVDDTGRDLVPDEEGKDRLETLQHGGSTGPDDRPAPVVVPMKLRNPARRAKALEKVSAEVELYVPGRDPNAVAIISGIAAWSGKRLENPALAASGVQIAMLTEDQLRDEKKRRSEQRKEDARTHGVLGGLLEPVASAFLAAFFTPEPGDVVLMTDDPDRRIVDMRLLDAAGQDRTTGTMQQQGLAVLSSTRRGPGPDWSLEVRLRTPKAQLFRSFQLRGVPLP
jgi:hypothetical protein